MAATAPDFETLYATHRRSVLAHAVRLVGETDAPDVAQRVWLRVFLRLDGFRGDAAVSSWLFRITRNAAHDWYRRSTTKVRRYEEPLEAALERADHGPLPDEVVYQRAQRAQLAAAIARLPTDQQAAVLARLEGFTVREVSDMLGLPRGTVKSRTFRGITTLTAQLQAHR